MQTPPPGCWSMKLVLVLVEMRLMLLRGAMRQATRHSQHLMETPVQVQELPVQALLEARQLAPEPTPERASAKAVLD